MKRLMLLLAFLISIGTSAFGQEEPVVTTLVLQESGTLLNLLTDEQIEQTQKIVISGNSLSSKDFAVLKTMIIQHKLTEVDIEETTTTEITEKAFEGCSSLLSINLPKFLVNTGVYSFWYCSGLTNIDLPASVTTIPNSFRDCSNLQSITLGRNIQWIGSQSFLYCFGLKEVHCKGTIPPACELGSFESSYSSCTLYVPEGYKKTYAFADGWLNFKNIQEEYVEPPYKLQVRLNGGTEAWRVCPAYESSGGNILSWISPSEECVIEVEKNEEVVIEISEQTTSINNWKIESILLNGENITSQLQTYNRLYLAIDQDSELEINMKDLNVPTEEKHVDVVLESAGTLGSKLLETPLSLITSLTVSGPMNDRDFEIIKQMVWVKKIDLSGALMENQKLPNSAFWGLYHLQEVVLPDDITVIGSNAFGFCFDVENIFPSINKVNLPKSLERIEDNAFEYCRNMEIIDLSTLHNLRSIGSGAFSSCSAIPAHLLLPNTLENIGWAAFAYTNVLSIDLSNTLLTEIPGRAFASCPIEGSLNFPVTLTYIGESAFDAASISSIKLKADKMVSLGNKDVFKSTDKTTCKVYVPKGLGATYKADTYWSPFGNNIEEYGYLVTVTQNNNYGMVSGGGAYEAGETVTLTADPNNPSEYAAFGGWYENNQRISSDLVYTFIMGTSDRIIEARFYWNGADDWWEERVVDDSNKIDGLNISASRLTVNGELPWALNSFVYTWPFHSYILVNSPMSATTIEVKAHPEELCVGWNFISLPYDVKISDIGKPYESSQFVIRYYDGASRAADGMGGSWKQLGANDVMKANQGYIMRTNGGSPEAVWYTFNSSIDDMNKLFNRSAVTIPLEKHTSNVPADANWNLVGNPFPCYFSVEQLFDAGLDGTVTVWSDDIQNYEYYTQDDAGAYLAPLTAFFIQHGGNTSSVTFNPEGRAATLPTTRAAVADLRSDAGREVINLLLANDSLSDKTRVVFNEAASTDYELGKDAAKFNSMNNNAPSLYTLDAQNQQLAINERPVGNGVVRLGCYIGVKGSYTLSAKEALASDLYLYDTETGASCNLRETSYTFTAEAGACNNRFELRTTLKGTGIAAIEGFSWQVAGNQLLLNGLPTGATVSLFDANGRMLFTGDAATATQGMAFPQSGIYYLTIRTAEGVSSTVSIKR